MTLPTRPTTSNVPLRNGHQTDWHSHTRWSDGQASVAAMLKQAEQLGMTLGISDHGLGDNARLQTSAQLDAYLAELAEYPVLRGIEISIGDVPDDPAPASPSQSASASVGENAGPAGERALSSPERTATTSAPRLKGLLDDLDYVIASLHMIHVPEGDVYATRYLNWRAGLYPGYKASVQRFDRRRYFATVLSALEASARAWPVTILGHFCLMPETANKTGTYTLAEDPKPDAVATAYLDSVLDLCLKYDLVVELNSKSRAPHLSFVRRAVERGARFSLGSDAHQLERSGDLSYGHELIEQFHISPDRLLSPHEILARREQRAA